MNNVQEEISRPEAGPAKRPKKSAASEERRAELKEKLIEAAERQIEAHGLSGVKARPLAETAGCALGAIYNVFPDLDSLILAVSARTLARLDAHLAPALVAAEKAGLDPVEAARRGLVDLALAYLDFAFAHRASWRALFEHRLPEGREIPEWLLADQLRLFGKVEALLEPLLPEMSPADRVLTARSLFSAVHGLVLLGLEEKLTAMPLGVLLDQLARLVRAIIRGLEAGR
jgi:AcrR family transcriptional regulator